MSTAAPKEIRYADLVEEPPPPPPKKKKLTKAEKKQRKLLAEQEFKKLEIRDLLRRELELTKKTSLKCRESWENMCKEIKIIEMKNELVEWHAKVNRVFEQKDEKVNLILDEMTITEEMHKRNFSTQLQMMDYLTDTFNEFQIISKLLYESQASEMLHDFYQEVDEKNDVEKHLKLNCEHVLHATNLMVEQEMLTDYQIFLDKRDDRENTEIEKRYQVRHSITNKMKSLRKQLLAFIDSLRNASLDVHKYERVNALMDRQRNFVTESHKLNDIEESSSNLYSSLQRDLIVMEADAKRKFNDLQLEHAYFVELRKKIENEMKQDQEKTHEKLQILSSESFKGLKKYQKIQKYGELLLSLAANCRKLQTESEKIMPVGNFLDNMEAETEEQLKLHVLDLKAHVDLTEEELQTEIHLMKNFWRRQALAEAQVVLLEKKKHHLTKENQHYINIIKRMSKTDDANDLTDAVKIQCVLNEETPCLGVQKRKSYK